MRLGEGSYLAIANTATLVRREGALKSKTFLLGRLHEGGAE